MSKRILIQQGEGGREIALLEDKRLLAYVQDAPAALQAEQIYLGAADRIVKGMEACFVRLGKDQTGFLPFAECMEKPRSGEKLLVQIKKPPVGDKAPYLTEDISLAGRYALLTPMTQRMAVSQKITEEKTREALLETAKRLAPPSMGLVMRTESAQAPEEEIAADVKALLSIWQEILEKQRTAQAPCLLRDREDALSRLLRDEHGKISEILTNAPEALPTLSCPVRACENPFELFSVKAKLEKSMQRKVWLDCGGYLVIDRTEAMTVIDVNSGKFTGCAAGTEDTFLKLNIEAAWEIARVLRLRGVGGIVIIDFVDMQSDESRALVLEALESALRDDPVKAVVHGFTSLGLVEMTRKKK